MKLNWYYSESTIKPLEIDTITSKNYIYLRKNIKEVSKQDESGETHITYEYEEIKLTKEQYEQYLKELSAIETLENIETLKAENDALREEVNTLTMCILEMSEMVYA